MKRRRHNHNYCLPNRENKDRLSDLPNCLLLHILSFLNAELVVRTCILSKRWNNLWKFLPILRLGSVKKSDQFMSKILSHRDSSTTLHTLHFHRYVFRKQCQAKQIIKYAVSHNVRDLDIYLKCSFQPFPRSLFTCRTLTSLKLYIFLPPPPRISRRVFFPKFLNLPALTSLSLRSFTFLVGHDGRVEPFSTLNKLNSLIINKCEVLGEKNLCISSATLVNLTIMTSNREPTAFFGFNLSAPNLSTFNFTGLPFQKLCQSNGNLSMVKHLSINVKNCFYLTDGSTPFVLLNWLVELANIKSLTLTSSTLKVLSHAPDLLKSEFSSLCNMESLNVKKESKSPLPDGLVEFLLQNSPSAEPGAPLITNKADIVTK
ncbi:F-box/LRR-repeat protein At3g26922-like [Vicia villosa]|uniref:F-box/LRR-repeat protein At3g26922-like n=1 Tax=Vicia villosa TaxID=3911 RepID=UPI00273CF324|nr:F-box/LRR-repeat protein At3g26922-like [Vicia villosa]